MADPQNQKPWKVEYAKSSRSSCKTCRNPIEKENLRFGKMVQATQFDGFMPMWNHASCIMKKAKQIKSTDDIEGLELLRWEDQKKIRDYVQSGASAGPAGPSSDTTTTSKASGIEVSQTSRATCRLCSQRILKGEVRISAKPEDQGARGWETIPVSDQAAVSALLKDGKKVEAQESKEIPPRSTSKSGTKRRKDGDGDDQKSKVSKSEGDVSTSRDVSVSNATEVEIKMEAQTKELWALKDDLKKHVTTVELRKMLEANAQSSTGSELDLRDHCADGMMFGALSKCPLCSGHLHYSGATYRCHGFLTAWTKCSYSTQEPERLKGKWKVPEDIENQFLQKWFKSQKVGKPARILPPPSSNSPGGHILEDGKSIYNTTLSMSDLSTGVNSYYILQIIQDDKSSECHVFRKWGRVGNDKIGGTKLDQMSKYDAISDFKRLFLEKTGNSWEAWEQKQDFRKQPGKFFPLDIDYGVNKEVSKKNQNNTPSKLPPQLAELMKMLFNVETYRAAMMEFEINMSEMPLGKLSKSNIQRGFEALTEIQNLLKSDGASSIKDSLIVDASNRFFTVIPSIHPHIIRDEDDFKSKLKMLEALQDIEIASRLVGFDADSDDSLDEKYKMLQCCMNPLPHDSEDYQLIEKYLLTTHAPTHTDWSLELEEVFSLEREGEFDKYAPYWKTLKNRMLLWHGSRFTNFVGILSQGLRIAPPEAPATGYMFGKGIYFADLVSKSAQYCYTDKKNPVGLMLLSEVALGEIHELKKATYMDKPPKGKHSTKGLGKKKPEESDYVKWRDDVTVPCGKPVDSHVRVSELMYNEYIVYDTAQVKMQFLLKVKFHHKR
ncbi:hypothetical protein ACLB2K_015901 [Fragaria x ananassa]